MLPHCPAIQRKKGKRGRGAGWIPAGGALPTFRLPYPLYPFRRLQYQQPRNSTSPRITVRTPIPAILAQEIDRPILVLLPHGDRTFLSSQGLGQPSTAPPSPHVMSHHLAPRAPSRPPALASGGSTSARSLPGTCQQEPCCPAWAQAPKVLVQEVQWRLTLMWTIYFLRLNFLSIGAGLNHFPQLSVHKKGNGH